ncbi:MAG TPA: sigma-54-dependent Fis family transcriptional regulator [Candidatus Marinimicrobia bacterium]|nr:sigma-54-dependent Fis family transcriptional regulator [Candidatus Neomarinimicrobiota bacterium]
MNTPSKYGIIGKSEEIQNLIATIEQVAPTPLTVLIQGESGTGKELVARAIHHLSLRKSKPYIAVNCGAIPSGTLESELFGHRKGSFTGAYEDRQGFFEAANGGTIFLDEIGEMPLETQVKLLRTLEQGEFIRVGENQARKVDVRVLTATNRELSEEVQAGNFRRDLYFRLKTITLLVVPLRKRREDIPLLAEFFMRDYSDQNNLRYKPISPAAIKILTDYPWEGNVRELRNVIQTLCIMERESVIRPETVLKHLEKSSLYPQAVRDSRLPVKVHNKDIEQVERELILRQLFLLRQDVEEMKELLHGALSTPLNNNQLSDISTMINSMKQIRDEDISQAELNHDHSSISDMEKEMIRKTLEKFYGHKRKAAQALGISERTLYRKIKDYDIDASQYK